MPSRNSNKANDGIRRARWNVRDLKTGTTTLVSVNSAGTASGNSASARATISADGRVVAFQSFATDPVAYGTSGFRDVFVRDLRTGTTTLVTVNSAGTASGNGSSQYHVMSADGRVVAFHSTAGDLVANDTNGSNSDVFVRDLRTGTTTLASVNRAGTGSGYGPSGDFFAPPLISADGRVVAFESLANDLVANDTNGTENLFVRIAKR